MIKGDCHIIDVIELGAYKAIVTFDSLERVSEALFKDMELLAKHFKEVKAWSKEEWCQTKRV